MLDIYKIYKIENMVNNKLYVGKTKLSLDKRFKRHIYNAENKINRYLYDAMNHYGYDNFKIELLETCTEDESNNKEKFFIKHFNSNDKMFGYNMTKGGDGGNTGNYHYGKSFYDWWLKKYGKKIADKMKNDTYNLISKKLKIIYSGVSFDERFGDNSESVKNKIRNTLKIKGHKPPTQYWKDKKHPMLGKTHSEISKNKMSNFRSGKTYEEIYGEEKAKQMRKKKSLFLSENNPNKREDFSTNDKIFILENIQNMTIKIISTHINRSPYEIRKFFRILGIKNIQKFKVDKNIENKLMDLIEKIRKEK